MPMEPPLLRHIKSEPGRVHFNNAGLSPMLPAAASAISSYLQYHSANGSFAWPELLGRFKEARELHAKLLDCEPECVAFFQTCASAISQVALGLDWKPDDEIIIWDQEYPSNAFPWFEASRRFGCSVTVLDSEPDFSVPTEKLIGAISSKTRMVAVSWVQYQTGAMTDIQLLSQVCKKNNCWLVVDAIQGLGAIPFSLRESGADAVCGGGHKWFLGPVGHGFLALTRERFDQLNPILHGAMTYGTSEDRPDRDKLPKKIGGRYEPGVPHLHGSIGSAASLRVLLSEGIENINQHALRMASLLREELPKIGAKVYPGGRESPIVTFVPEGSLDRASKVLLENQISHASGRAGGIRVSPHGFTTEEDCERLLGALRRS